MSMKVAKFAKVASCSAICLRKASRISFSLKPIVVASTVNEDECISSNSFVQFFLLLSGINNLRGFV